jgi:hypothetical protein
VGCFDGTRGEEKAGERIESRGQLMEADVALRGRARGLYCG